MTTYKNNIFLKIGKKIIRALNYNAKKSLNIYIGALALFALVNVFYVSFLANITQVTFRTFLDKNPINTVMIIISTMDVIFAYILWMERDTLLHDRKKFQGMIGYLSILQLLVGNILCLVLGVVTLFTSKEISTKSRVFINSKQLFPLIMGAVIYIFCSFLLLKISL